MRGVSSLSRVHLPSRRGERVRGQGTLYTCLVFTLPAHCLGGLWNKLFLLRQAPMCPSPCYLETLCPGSGQNVQNPAVEGPGQT